MSESNLPDSVRDERIAAKLEVEDQIDRIEKDRKRLAELVALAVAPGMAFTFGGPLLWPLPFSVHLLISFVLVAIPLIYVLIGTERGRRWRSHEEDLKRLKERRLQLEVFGEDRGGELDGLAE